MRRYTAPPYLHNYLQVSEHFQLKSKLQNYYLHIEYFLLSLETEILFEEIEQLLHLGTMSNQPDYLILQWNFHNYQSMNFH